MMASSIPHLTINAFRQAFVQQPVATADPDTFSQIGRLEDMAPQLRVPTLMHRTAYNYLVLPTQGQSQHLYNTEQIQTSPDTLLLVRVDTITAVQSISSNIAGYFIGFTNPVIDPLLTPYQRQQWYSMPPLLPLTSSEQVWLQSLCELLMAERMLTTSKLSESALHLLTAMIVKLLPKATDFTTGLSRDQLLTTRFKQLVGQHCCRYHYMQYYANELAVSENYLFRCVKRVTGKAPKTVLLETLVLHAMVQLQNTTLDINAIANGLGIEDTSYFGRLFKKHTTLTPTGYRQLIQHDLSGS
ncbi:helix-turn-helix transcriptional regulator [Spirosoma radiotolerans]|uniref:helix-turn-helix transcriptional regulator n=1 Tax=Spirosoma radiotolerans TaxID=1379870 RepID=UPI0006963FB5|nr:helix-turn-helix transcriptional regulator [Spirosoma radiotolerans]